MSELYGYSPEEFARLEEFGKLSDRMAKEEDKIEKGIDTSAAQLDRYLAAATAFYLWKAHHPHPDHPPEERENSAEWYLRYKRVLNGGYHTEKATYALEQAMSVKVGIDKRAKHLQDPTLEVKARVAFTAQNEMFRPVVANWLRTAANCLDMPTDRPPTQQETTP